MIKKLKVLSLFSGIGAFEKALSNIGVDYELAGFSEIDKYAIKSYCAIHNVENTLNFGDITKINIENLPIDIDLITHGSPCQDYSIAGKGEGGDENSNTRSSLMWNTVEIVRHCKPKYVIWENVKNVLSKKHKQNFDKYINDLDDMGYTSYYKVLNAKDYGIPQNTERIFVISIRKDIEYVFEFAKGFVLKMYLKDILEDSVEDKYYINKPFHLVNKGHQAELDIKGHDCIKRVYSIDKIAPTLTTMGGGNTEPKIIEETQSNIIKYTLAQNVKVRKYKVNIEKLKNTLKTHKQKLGLTINNIANTLDINKTTVEHWFRNDNCFSVPDAEIWLKLKQLLKIETDEFDKPIMEFIVKPNEYDMSNRVYDENGIAPTLTCTGESGAKKIVQHIEPQFKIRKLTPLECWRLMGFEDEDFYKAQKIPTSNSQLYKQAGNSIVVNVLEEIFKKLFKYNN